MSTDRLAKSLPLSMTKASLEASLKYKESKSMGSTGKSHNRMSFGSPSYPSPLDRIRTGKRERAAELGLHRPHLKSFEGNQSFPKPIKSKLREEFVTPEDPPDVKCTLKDIKGIGMNDVSFSVGVNRGSFAPPPDPQATMNLGESWSYYKYLGGAQNNSNFPSTVRNPNKAIVTVNAATSEILIANEMACELFGFSQSELIGLNLNDLVTLKHTDHVTLKETHLEETGEMIEVSGKVMDAIDSSGLVIPVSVWVRRLGCEEQTNRCLIVMEPVERTTAEVMFDSTGTILSCDDQFANLHGYVSDTDVMGLKMNDLVPSFVVPAPGKKLDKRVKKQRATGRTKDGALFPLSVFIKSSEEMSVHYHDITGVSEEDSNIAVYNAIVWVFANISGLITFLPDGTIQGINHNFALMLFGYSQDELVGKDITKLFPHLYEELDIIDTDSMPLPPMSDDEEIIEGKPASTDLLNGGSVEMPEKSRSLAEMENADLQGAESGLSSSSQSPDLSYNKCTGGNGNDEDRNNLNNTACLLTEAADTIFANRHSLDDTNPDLSDTLDLLQESSTHISGVLADIKSDLSDSTTDSGKAVPSVKSPRKKVKGGMKGKQKGEKSGKYLFGSDGISKENSVDSIEPFESLENKENSLYGKMLTGNTKTDTEALNEKEKLVNQCIDIEQALTGKQKEKTFSLNDSQAQKTSKHEVHSDTHTEKTNTNTINSNKQTEKASTHTADSNKQTEKPMAPRENIEEQTEKSSRNREHRPRLIQTTNSVHRKLDGEHNITEHKQNGQILSPVSRDVEGHRSDSSNLHLSSLWNERRKDEKSMVNLSHSVSDHSFADDSSGTSGIGSKDSAGTTPSRPDSNLSMNDLNACNLNKKSANALEEELKHLEEMAVRMQIETSTPARPPGMSDTGITGKGSRQQGVSQNLFKVPPPKRQLSITDQIQNGTYMGKGQHRDGSLLSVVYQIRKVKMENGQVLLCMWASRDPGDAAESAKSLTNFTMASSFTSSVEDSVNRSLGQALLNKARGNAEMDKVTPGEKLENNEEDAETEGLTTECVGFEQNYQPMQCIGKGAFGFVKLARRRRDKEEVVVKYIKKAKVLKGSWLNDPDLGYMPFEICVLSKLDHPNIVMLLDVYENTDFMLMVMEKHGSGMDLFEFIDRCPNLDEALASYLFRQLVKAVNYLNDLSIVHRDIKDENVILNERFQVKLIDFGSASYFKPGQLFGTFCGTLEYCSPEVLKGNKYEGPELEIWSLGVTLYTLVFGENPFYDVDETIKGVLKPPFPVSDDLMDVIGFMLHPQVDQRASIQELLDDPWVWQPISIKNYSWEQVLPNSEFHGNTAGDARTYTHEDKLRENSVETESESDAEDLETELQRCLHLSDDEHAKQYAHH